jgi:Arc/MetJ family transcription regulator
MRTNIDIDDTLLEKVMQGGTYRTKREAVHAGLQMLADIKGQTAIRKLRGNVLWEGDLDDSRKTRFPDWQDSKV